MNLSVGHRVVVRRDLVRVEGPYARAGEKGTIVEIFRSGSSGPSSKNGSWYAKVDMDSNEIKTFRLTSLRQDRSSV